MDSSKQFPAMIFSDDFVEHVNIGWRIEPGQKDSANPLLEAKYPWDNASPSIGHGTVLKDPLDNLYKYWGVSCSKDLDLSYGRSRHPRRLTYACSEDGVHWKRPKLDVCSFPGFPKTNILFDLKDEASYASVFIDPEENPEEPYEMFALRTNLWPQCLIYRYRSSDGIHWRKVEGPLNLDSRDSFTVYKIPGEGYVCHQKNALPSFPGGYVHYDCAAGSCRVIMQRRSSDGSNWSGAVPAMMPDWKDHPADQIMDMGYYPYGKGVIAITSIYHAIPQTLDLQFAASKDGQTWWRPARRSCLPLEPLGENGGSMTWPTRTLIDEDDRLYLYYGAVEALHGDIYAKTEVLAALSGEKEASPLPNILGPWTGTMCRASWEKGRMWAALPAAGGTTEAILTTAAINCSNKTLRINALTLEEGEISAELLDEKQKPIKGFSRRDSIAFKGDEKFACLKWKESELPEVDKVHIRFYLKRARLYGYELI